MYFVKTAAGMYNALIWTARKIFVPKITGEGTDVADSATPVSLPLLFYLDSSRLRPMANLAVLKRSRLPKRLMTPTVVNTRKWSLAATSSTLLNRNVELVAANDNFLVLTTV